MSLLHVAYRWIEKLDLLFYNFHCQVYSIDFYSMYIFGLVFPAMLKCLVIFGTGPCIFILWAS